MKRFLAAALLLSAPVFLFAGCKEKVEPGTAEVERAEITGLKIAEAATTEITDYTEAAGTIKARSVSSVASRLMGTVTSVNVKEGDRVKKGSPLLTIEANDIAEKIKQAEAGYREALKGLEMAKENRELVNTTYDRYKKLFDAKAISRQEFDNISTQKRTAEIEYERMEEAVKRARSGVSETKVMRGFASITSPVSGIVTEKRIDVGSMATPGMTLFTIEDTSSYLIEVSADERLANIINIDMLVSVTIDSIDKKIDGKVSEIIPAVNPMTRSFMIKVSVNGEGLRSGLYARVRIPAGKKTLMLVPAPALVNKGQLTGVYTVDETGLITFRLVRAGSRYGNDVEVLSGLNPSEKIVIEGAESAIDGAVAK